MAYSTSMKKIYVDTSQTPNIGVSIDDLKQCFGVTIQKKGSTGNTDKGLSCELGVIFKGSVGDEFTDTNNVTWKVVSRRDVNMWAKHKPLRRTKIQPLSGTNYTTGGPNNDVYGIYQDSLSNPYPYYYDGSKKGQYMPQPWKYDKPLITDTIYYARISDFENYYHNAPCPVGVVLQSNTNDWSKIEISSVQTERENDKLHFALAFEQGINSFSDKTYYNDGTCMALNDILAHDKGKYLAVVLWRVINGVIRSYFAFSSETIQNKIDNPGSDPLIHIWVPIQDFYSSIQTQVGGTPFADGDEWNCRVFLCATNSTQNVLSNNVRLIQYDPVPENCDYKLFTIETKDSVQRVGSVTLNATLSRSSSGVYYLSQFNATIQRGSLYGAQNISYKIFGVAATGKIVKGGVEQNQDSGFVLYEDSISIDEGTNSGTSGNKNLTTSNGTFVYDNTDPQKPWIAVVGVRIFGAGSSNYKEVSITFQISKSDGSGATYNSSMTM